MVSAPYHINAARFNNLNPDTTNTFPHANNVTVSVANTKGGWTELIASTPQPADMLFLYLMHSGTSSQCLIDIGIGGAGSEVVVASDIFMDNERYSSGCGGQVIPVPIHVPEGVRLAVRFQASSTAETLYVGCVMTHGGWYVGKGFAKQIGEGLLAASSRGTDVDPGGTANTKGSWQELVASTSENYAAFWMSIGWSANSAATASTQWLIDIALGAGGSEVIIAGDLCLQVEAIADRQCYSLLPVMHVPIAAGTRVAVRAQSTETDATDRLFDCTFNGLVA